MTERYIATTWDLEAARQVLRFAPEAQLITTGCALEDTTPGQIESVIVEPEGIISRHRTMRLPIGLPGTGDLFAGLTVAGLARGVPLPRAVEIAQNLTSRALDHAMPLAPVK
ncbi:bifunctional hydroxymethylpyrimidine kinase/phosphomethylpyrimidine kinase [Sinorhizobium medicae]|uniref:bifunctional hydroxymethylpyrimidine kinase/phosphomethylpyrimidine kinase n=1 Tax=Sinorhizobium medicae TaxID=110321 RepID=UPI002357A23C|nr:bifunctional hydroxymethylpyrimidine kinase/phosphomethylpyrimidine kinase [Sinorhizobium medicae]